MIGLNRRWLVRWLLSLSATTITVTTTQQSRGGEESEESAAAASPTTNAKDRPEGQGDDW